MSVQDLSVDCSSDVKMASMFLCQLVKWLLLFPAQLHMLRVSPSMGQVLEMNTTLRHLLFLLEYCMVTGYDWWDVLLHVQPSMVHNLVEKLHEEYMRQNQALQQVSKHHGRTAKCYFIKIL